MSPHRPLSLLTAVVTVSCIDLSGLAQNRSNPKPTPTHADVSYGSDPRHVFDLWLADSDDPTPLAIYIHGGGFSGGSKNTLNGRIIKELLDARISVAALHYRLIGTAKLPAAHDDCRRALQYLRYHSQKWNLDKTRIAAFGGSAGAQLSMYLAFHDDQKDPNATDPIARESTRLTCVATSGGQATMRLDWWQKNIPGYDAPHRPITEYIGELDDASYEELMSEISALELISNDDPPIYMTYGMAPDAPIPSEANRARGWKIHHVNFGIALQRRMTSLSIEANLGYPGSKNRYASRTDFLIKKLRP